MFGIYVKVILSIRLELSSFFPHVSFETAFLLNRKWLLLPFFCGSSCKTFLRFQSDYRCNICDTSMRPSIAIKSSMWPSVENVCPRHGIQGTQKLKRIDSNHTLFKHIKVASNKTWMGSCRQQESLMEETHGGSFTGGKTSSFSS